MTVPRSGMRVSWVLSQEERARRFQRREVTRGLAPCFTLEEALSLEQLNDKFEVPWLEHFFSFDPGAATNWLEYSVCSGHLDPGTWRLLGEAS